MTSPTAGVVAFFTSDHRACDETWASLEALAARGDASACGEPWARFQGAMRRHFSMEEDVLFPALEGATGAAGGPVAVMRHEHAQMRSVLDEMDQRARARDLQGVLDQGDTLLMLIQQHNAKEESVLYPLAHRVLAPSWNELAGRLAAY